MSCFQGLSFELRRFVFLKSRKPFLIFEYKQKYFEICNNDTNLSNTSFEDTTLKWQVIVKHLANKVKSLSL